MQNINWNEVKDQAERPESGGYVAMITAVEDDEKKQCLFIKWDFVDGPFKGANAEAAAAIGFWPMTIARSYKQKALGFFKAFKTAVENSNHGYVFKNDPQSLVGKLMGVVLGEEAYVSKKGDVRTRTYVYQTRSVRAIQSGDYTIPDFKPLVSQPASPFGDFSEATDTDEELPF